MLRVVDQNVECFLLKEFKAHWENDPARRCLYLRFSDLQQDTDELLLSLEKFIAQDLDDDIKKIYICDDGDIFILSRSLTHRRVKKFLSHLIPTLSPAPYPGLATLFEIGIHWGKLRTLLEKKIAHKEHLEHKSEAGSIELDFVSRKELLEGIDSDLVKSVAERRMGRAMPEILIVEDDPFSQNLVKNALKNSYSLTSTTDGQGAILNYVTKAPDVLFLDIGLPDISGHEVLEKIFDLDPSAYIVMFSGNGDRENVMESMRLGAKGFVGKPFTQDKLMKYIDKSPFIQAKQKDIGHEHRVH